MSICLHDSGDYTYDLAHDDTTAGAADPCPPGVPTTTSNGVAFRFDPSGDLGYDPAHEGS